MQKPFFEHDCTSCVYLGSALVLDEAYDFYVHTYTPGSIGNTGVPTLIYRDGSEGSAYGSCPVDYVSPLSLPAMMALGLYIRHLGANGASGTCVRGSFFKNSEPVLRLWDIRPKRPAPIRP